jgi:hypothetical protein
MRVAFARTSALSEVLVQTYLEAFNPVTEPYSRHVDFTHRYFSVTDVSEWSAFLIATLPAVLECAADRLRDA